MYVPVARLERAIDVLGRIEVPMKCKPDFTKLVMLVAAGMAFSSFVFGLSGPLPAQAQQQAGSAGSPAQAAAQSLSFEVASIKPSEGDGRMVRIQMSPGGRYSASGVTVKMLMQQAYDVKDFQIVGGPAWMSSAPFDINAKSEDPNVARDQVRLMLQSLLAERFQLKFHRETRELPVYALVVGRNGPKLQLSAIQPAPEGAPATAPKPGATPAGGVGAKAGGTMMSMGRGQISAQMAPMAAIVNMLAQQLGRPVIDKTDLKGNFDFKLEWTPDETARSLGIGTGGDAAPAADSSGPSIFTAVQEQLGLRLESQKGPVEVLVIDAVEKPSGN
jgi:uncharacterized protein (TIGR03435 family)